MTIHKVCRTCGEEKDISCFPKLPTAKDGYKNICKSCTAIKYEIWRKKNYDKWLENMYFSTIKRKFGISKEDYIKLLTSQQGVCAICGGGPTGKAKYLSVDHDHETGKIRGLLCNNCNAAIGFLREKHINIQLAAEYIRKE